jgi:4-aminobutyrate aminotransferase-like enzyme
VGVQTQSRELAARMVNGLRQEGVLIGAAGRNADVLKIRPPLSFSRANADLFLEIFAAVLRRL